MLMLINICINEYSVIDGQYSINGNLYINVQYKTRKSLIQKHKTNVQETLTLIGKISFDKKLIEISIRKGGFLFAETYWNTI